MNAIIFLEASLGPDWSSQLSSISTLIYTIITLAGTVYLIRNFHEQRAINERQEKIKSQQAKLNELALEKHRRDVRPEFFIASSTPNFYTLSLKNAVAINVITMENDGYGSDVEDTDTHYEVWHPGKNSLRIEHPRRSYEECNTDSLNIYFFDEDGRQYLQIVSHDVGRTYISFPKLMSDGENTKP